MQIKLLGLPDDVVSAIDIDRFSSDQLGIVSRQDGGRDADVLDTDKLSRRCAFGGELEQIIEMINSGSSARLHGPRRYGVDADPLWPELIGEIAHSAFPRGLYRFHHVVMLDNLLGTVISL
jgi:hypothetical protein